MFRFGIWKNIITLINIYFLIVLFFACFFMFLINTKMRFIINYKKMAALRVLGETSRKVSSFIRLNGLAAVPQGNFFSVSFSWKKMC